MDRIAGKKKVRAKRAPRPRHTTALELLEVRRLMAARIVGSSTVYATIQAAVDAAAAGSTINVDAGNYAEQVNLYKSLNIRGAQAGVDARSNARGVAAGAAESIATGITAADGTISFAFKVTANNVTIDGFTFQGQTSASNVTGAAVVINPNINGTKVLNNIVQNNVTGLYLSNNSTTNAALIQHNVFRNNNNAGAEQGRGIYTDGSVSGGTLTNITIDGNFFYKNLGPSDFLVQPAIGLEAGPTSTQSNIRITNNVFDTNGKALLAYNASNLTITGNVIGNHWDVSSGALRFEGNVKNVTISNNNLYGSGGRAIRIDQKAASGDNSGFVITNNNIYQNGLEAEGQKTGLMTNTAQYSGTLNAANNWWGASNGPSGDFTGSGDAVLKQLNSVTVAPYATAPVIDRQVPWYGVSAVTGAPIQAEDFDHGLEGVSYHDADSSNSSGSYRPNQGVDLASTTDGGAGYMVTSTKSGEWIEYGLNVLAAGTYTFTARVASSASGATFHLEVDGVNVSGPISIPSTGSSSTFGTLTKTGVSLPVGAHLLRLVFDANNSGGNAGNWNWMKFAPTSVAAPPTAPSALTATLGGATQVNLAWTDNSSSETGFVVERKTGSTGVYATLATTAANVTSFIDFTVAAGTTYFYRVSAIGSGGTSVASNEASATTAASNTVYLSDLNWVGTPANGWGPAEKDMSNGGSSALDGKVITLNGITYAKGLGVNALSDITYNIGGGYQTFISDIGQDDETGSGSVVFQVYADGVKVYDSGTMGQTTATKTVSLGVTGVQILRLVVTDAGDGADFDHADWAGARLIIASGPPTAPAAPSGLQSSAISNTQINLTWADNSGNETGFILERSTDNITFTQVATPAANATSYSDSTGLSATTLYYYRIRATNAVGPSAKSNISSATTLAAPTAPLAPSSLSASAISASQINLTWIDNSNNETGFILERSTDNITFTQIATPLANATSYSDTALSPGVAYYYRVRATNAVAPSAHSNVSSATTLNSGSVTYIPTGSTWKYLDNGTNQGTAWRTIGLDETAWKSGAAQLGYGDGDETTVVGYGTNASSKFVTTYFRKTITIADASLVSALNLRIMRDDGAVIYINGTEVFRTNMPTGTIAYNTFASTAVEDNSYFSSAISPSLLVSGNNVIAVEIHQSDAASSDISFDFELTATVSQPATAPAAPTSLTSTAVGTSQVNLTWLDNASNETGYKVERSTDNVNFTQIGVAAANATSYSDATGLSSGTQYFYRVRATNSAGDSGNSNVANSTTAVPTTPAAPGTLAAAAAGSTQINLTWVDNANNETGFILERSTDNVTFTQIATPAANATSYSDSTGLGASTQYFYRIRATNGVGPSANSNVANATTTAIPAPAAPTNLLATAVSVAQINLTWTDASNNETNFILERSTDNITFTPIATPAMNATSYGDSTGLSASTKYYYRIRATGSGGDSLNAVANATTLASTALPSPWVDADIGSTGLAGSATYNAGVYTMKGAGTDIWGTADGFNFVYQPWTGDGQIIARVTGVQNTNSGAHAGVMIRQSLAANAAEASVVLTSSLGIGFVRRTTAGGASTVSSTTIGAAPYWLKLVRSGNSFTAYQSPDGTTWTQVGAAVTISMTGTVYIGLVACSKVSTTLGTMTLDSVSTSASTSSTLAGTLSAPVATLASVFNTTKTIDGDPNAASSLLDSLA